jgi:hypothetical protein
MDKATRPNGKRRLTRRPNSCEPCRQSKLRVSHHPSRKTSSNKNSVMVEFHVPRVPKGGANQFASIVHSKSSPSLRTRSVCRSHSHNSLIEKTQVRAVLCSNWDDQTFWQKYKDIGVGQAFYERRQMVKDKRLFGQYSMARAIDRVCYSDSFAPHPTDCSSLNVCQAGN